VLKVLTRASPEQLIKCVEKLTPAMATLMGRERYIVIKTLFERCAVRGCEAEIQHLRVAVIGACGGDPKDLIPTVCYVRD